MAQNDLQNKVALVTGGTRGIGRAIAQQMLEEGMRVAICGTSPRTVDAALEKLSPKGNVLGLVADVSQLPEVKQLVAAVHQAFGTIDVLVNNAGIGVFRPTAELDPSDWDRMISLNLSGAYYCSHEILPILKQAGGGDIVNISSLAGKNPFAGGAGYNASKFGLIGFSEALMLDHRNAGIRVTSVMPGSVATEFSGGSAEEGAEWKIAPEDVAEAVMGMLRMPRRTTVSRIEIRPSMPGPKPSPKPGR
jgi:NAD(P)-dependent dehydrogenase (short-subunit alcohol dehydrogenase family)